MHDGKYRTIYELIRTRVKHGPQAVAILAPGRSALNYGELLGQVDRIVRYLNVRGVQPGDRVAIVLPNGPEMAVAFLGVAAAAICAPLNPAYSRSEIEFYLSDLKPKALIVQSGMNSAAIAVAEERGISIVELLLNPEAAAGIFDLPDNELSLTADFHFPQTNDIALILYTSGTTSRPKMVPLTHANLIASAGNIAATVRLSEADRCLNVMPLFHIHGLVGALLSSLAAGGSVVCTAGFEIEQFFPWLKAFRPTWYTAVPTIHHAVLSRAQADRTAFTNHTLRFIRSSSAALPARVMQGLEESFQVPVIESYGMTEAAHQMASSPLPPGQRKIGSVGPAAGPEVSIMDATGKLLSTGEVGEIVIRGANVMSGYGNSEANAEAFTRGWFRTGDQGYLDPDGYLFISGRLKEIINRGGEKISPREVDEVILQHPAVAEAISFAIAHETLGEDIAAAVVLRKEFAVSEGELQQFVAVQLARFKIPQRFLFVDELRKGATGKIQRIGLADKFADVHSGESIREFLAPQTQVEKTLAAIWSEVLGVEQIGIQDNFFYLGGDSIRATQVISRVRDSIKVELSILSMFENPTVAGLAACIEKTRAMEPRSSGPSIRPVASNNKWALSFAQQRLWFLNQLEPESPVYNRPLALRLTGKLHAQAIERCVNEIVRRHEVLRTNFYDNGGQPFPVIAPVLTVDLPIIDLSHLPDSAREAEALRQATREAQQLFDLARGALLRARLYRLGEQDHLLLFVTHHIIFDGWSDSVLLREIAALYPAIINGNSPPLSDLPIQYGDYATWQGQQNEEKTLDTDLSYWRQQLANAPAQLGLPTDRPRPVVQTYRGARRSFALPVELSERLKELSSREHVTLFMTLMAAFNILLYRYTGQEDILVGVPTAGRNRVETEQLLGDFINTLVLRTDLSGDPSFHELLRRTRQVALGAYDHQDLPFDKLIEVLQPDRDLSRNALFDVMFQLRNMPHRDVALPGLSAACVDLDIGVAKLDLTLEVTDEEQGLECRIEYNTDLFDHSTINRMAGHFQTLLEGIAADPDRRLSDLPLLTVAEKHQLLVEWNDTQTDYPKDQCVHELFESQVEKTPDTVAVVFKDQQLTYRELNTRANQLAHYLMKLGVGPEVLVGICVERSIEMIVGLLGILKAGGAYVPLDPSDPKERLAGILDDIPAPVLVSKTELVEIFSERSATLLCLDSEWEIVNRESQENPRADVTADHLAYVIYTSGSTGRPKGVQITHRALTNFTASACASFALAPGDRVLQFASISFDAAAEEIYPSLMCGAGLVLRTDSMLDSVSSFLQRCAEWGVTVLDLPTAYWHEIAERMGEESLRLPECLRLVIIGGEKAVAERLVQWRKAVGDHVRLLNTYGPTETTVVATTWESSGTAAGDQPAREVPIGRPIANVRTYVLDRQSNSVPIGLPGELHIGGVGLARGYLNHPDLTAEKFIANPFSIDPTCRLYKTGDLARYLPDGNIEFLGRMDDQVKIRGFRIELGEVEAVLGQHSAVREAVVVAREYGLGDRRLVAYVVARPDALTNDLRNFLQQKLPEYMVPSAFMFLESLPLTPNGKMDRKALPAPDQSRPELEETFTAPRAPVEEILASIWAGVLKLEKIGIHDNFFHLGGHSLLATQVVSRIRSAFSIEFPLRTLFELPTVAEMAAMIEQNQAKQASDPALAQMLSELEAMSDEEAQKIVAK